MTKEGALMRNLSSISFQKDSASDDEIDQLFSHLEQFEPPADFVERVMAKVSRLPLPQFRQTSTIESNGCFIESHQSISQ
jgi:hypothetical protein